MAGNSPLKNLFYVIGAIIGKNAPPNMAQIPISNPNPKMKSFTEDEYLAIQAAIQSRDLDESHKQVLSKFIKTPEKHNGVADLYVDGAADLHTKTAAIGGAIFMNGQEIISFSDVMFELNQIDHWSVAHVRREKNTRTDILSKNGMQKARESK